MSMSIASRLAGRRTILGSKMQESLRINFASFQTIQDRQPPAIYCQISISVYQPSPSILYTPCEARFTHGGND
jgi:hypothetical protein